MKQYAKAIAAVVVTVLAAIAAAMTGDNTISATEWVNVAILAIGACGVFAAPNVPGARYTKAILAVLTAALTVLASAVTGGVSATELIQIIMAAAGAVGVYAVPNEPAVTTH